jgi:UMF1 family MFS transporter
MGVQTVMLLAPPSADKEIGMGADEMIYIVLILQANIGGAYFLLEPIKKKEMDFAISCTLIIWIIICTLPATI